MRSPPIVREVRRRLIVAALSALPLLFLLGIAKAENDDHAPEPPVIKGLDHAH